jgi:hypothetical protein
MKYASRTDFLTFIRQAAYHRALMDSSARMIEMSAGIERSRFERTSLS